MVARRQPAGSRAGGRFARTPSPQEVNTGALAINIDSFCDELEPLLAEHPKQHEAAFVDATIKFWVARGEKDKMARLYHKSEGSDAALASEHEKAKALEEERYAAWNAALESLVKTETTNYNRSEKEARNIASKLMSATAQATHPLSLDGHAGANRPTRKGRKAIKAFRTAVRDATQARSDRRT